jgi:hypothetical protein
LDPIRDLEIEVLGLELLGSPLERLGGPLLRHLSGAGMQL